MIRSADDDSVLCLSATTLMVILQARAITHQCRTGSPLGRLQGSQCLTPATRKWLPASTGNRRQKLNSVVVYAAKDYYQVLGVPKEADKKALKAAYRWCLVTCTLSFHQCWSRFHELHACKIQLKLSTWILTYDKGEILQAARSQMASRC